MGSADTPWPPPRPAAGAPTRPPSARRRHSCSGLPSAVGSPSGRQAPNAPRVRRPHRTRVPPRQVGAHRRRAGRRRRVEAEESHRKGGISRVGAQKEGFFLLFSFFCRGRVRRKVFFLPYLGGPDGYRGWVEQTRVRKNIVFWQNHPQLRFLWIFHPIHSLII